MTGSEYDPIGEYAEYNEDHPYTTALHATRRLVEWASTHPQHHRNTQEENRKLIALRSLLDIIYPKGG